MEGPTTCNNNLCVETKGVCFFCFHENQNSSQPKEGDHEPDVALHNISLKRLSKYLSVDYRKVFKLNIPLQCTNMSTSDVIVPLCAECATLTRKFSKLHHELELLKMHVHSCIHKIREKMVKADSGQDLAVTYQKRWIMSNPVDAIQAEIVDNLRKETKEKCLKKIESLLPRVKLEKLCKRNSRKRACETSISNDNSPIIPPKQSAKNFTKTNKITIPIPAHPEVRQDQNSKKSLAKSIPSCPVGEPQIFCSEPNIPTTTAVLKSPSKSTGNSHTFTTPMAPPPPPILPPSRPYQQPQPSLRYVPMSSASMSSKLNTNDHTTSKSNSCQRPIKSTEKPQRKPAQAEGSPSYDCVYCEQSFEDKSTLRIHVVRSHCEQFFTTLKDRNLSPEEFKSIVYLLFKDVAKSHADNNSSCSPSKTSYTCPHCHMTHESDGDVYAHMFRFHYSDLTSKLLTLQKETLTKRGTANHSSSPDKPKEPPVNHNPSLLLCACGMRYASKRTLDFHQRYNCKLKSTQKEAATPDVISSKGPSSSTATSSNSLQSSVTYTPSTITAANQFHCAHCAKGFRFYHDHRVHLLTSHRIEEFSKYVSTGVTSEQVDTELQRILQTYRRLPGNDNAGGCLFCSEVFSQVTELQHHILVGHFDVVVFKLRSIVPQQQQRMYVAENNTVSPVVNSSNNDVGGGPSTCVPAIHENVGNVCMPVKEDNTTPLSCDTVEIIMEDPLSLDFIELDPNAILCQEEEQLKMEWLFSFIDEDGTEIQTQPEEQTSGEEKGFLVGNMDSELILP